MLVATTLLSSRRTLNTDFLCGRRFSTAIVGYTRLWSSTGFTPMWGETRDVCIHLIDGIVWTPIPHTYRMASTVITRTVSPVTLDTASQFPLSLTLTHGPVGIASILGVSFQHHHVEVRDKVPISAF